MIENLNGLHEIVTYKENTNLRLYTNTQAEDYPNHWHTPHAAGEHIFCRSQPEYDSIKP